MQNKEIILGSSVQERALEGITILANVVKVTLGPAGRPVLLQREGTNLAGEPNIPMITKDGVTVAEYVKLSDPVQDAAIQIMKSVCKNTNDAVGDGTTGSVVLAAGIMQAAASVLAENPELSQKIRLQIEDAALEVESLLTGMAVNCDIDIARKVALISANGDATIADAVQKAYNEAGPNGVIVVDQGGIEPCTIQTVDGYQFRKGAQSPVFFNTKDDLKFEADETAVLILDEALNDPSPIISALNAIYSVVAKPDQNGAPTQPMPSIVIVANSFSPHVIQLLSIAKMERGLSVCAIEGPEVTTSRTHLLDDLAVYLGGERLGAGKRTLQSLSPLELCECLGKAGRVKITANTTTFYDGNGTEDSVGSRLELLKQQKEQAPSTFDAARLTDRMAALAGGVVKLLVGGQSDVELKERYHRVEDAVNAVAAALDMGIVPGGGVALLNAANMLKNKSLGADLLREAMVSPYKNIRLNADPSIAFDDIPKKFKPGTAEDVRTGKKGNFIDLGVIDPLKVIIMGLRNAVSVSTLLLTCGGIIVNEETPK